MTINERFHVTFLQPGTMTSMAERYCEHGMDVEGNSTMLSPDLDAQLAEVQNVSREISDQLKLNVSLSILDLFSSR